MAVSGIEVASGLRVLESLTEEVWWRGRSKLLCHACEGLVPGMRFSATDEPARTRAGTRRRVALSITSDRDTAVWTSEYGLDLLLPPAEVVVRAGDKIRLPALAAAAGVRVPASTIVRGLDEAAAARAWQGLPLVVQRPENDLTGNGTRFVETRAQLLALGAEWRGRDVKVCEYCDGLPLTVSGCVMPGTTLVSGISHQLVGLKRVTMVPAAHCGNQLLNDDELPVDVVSECRAACVRLGDELRDIGFLGMFGLDVLADGSTVRVIEVNPRIQGVSSLGNAAERTAGLLPMPGAHVLALLGVDTWEHRTTTLQARGLSQLFVYARDRGAISATLPSGAYEIVGGELRHIDPAPSLDDVAGRRDAALAWPFVEAGDSVHPGVRVIVLQFGARIAPVDNRPTLLDWVEPWIAAFENELGLSGTA